MPSNVGPAMRLVSTPGSEDLEAGPGRPPGANDGELEQFVAVAMEAEGLIVSEAVKFPVRRQARKVLHDEVQTHGYEVDLVSGDRRFSNLYLLLNDPVIRAGVGGSAAEPGDWCH